MTTLLRTVLAFAPLAALLGCNSDSDGLSSTREPGISAQAFSLERSPWSAPVNLGTAINTPSNEQGPTLSKDGLELYFGSDRTGGAGSFDLYVSHRDCLDCPWQTPVNLASINTSASETGASLSIDGHMLFFTSNRPGGQGNNDLYLSPRSNPHKDLGWEPAVGLGTGVNTAGAEGGAEYFQNAEEGAANFYFNRGPVGGASDIYVAAITRDGETLGPASRVDELSDPVATDQGSSLRTDGKEIYFFSPRAGSLGSNDLWVATRQSVHEPWGTPVNPGAPLNSANTDQQPGLSFDGRTLVFASARPGSFGGTDIYISTRTPNGREIP